MAIRNEVVTVGRLYADVVLWGLPRLPRLGREDYAQDVMVAPGGGAFITAAHLAGLGHPVRLCASLGNDPLSISLEPAIEAAGLTLDHVERFDGGPQLTVSLAIADDRAMATRRMGPAAPETARAVLQYASVRHLHIAELASLREAPWLLDIARAAGLTVSLDLAWDEEALRDPASRTLVMAVDLLFPNLSEAAALLNCDECDWRALLRGLAELGVPCGLKCGADGGVLIQAGQTWSAKSKALTVVDATGAGDAFVAGFLSAWLEGLAPERCLERGVACGGFAVGRLGGAAHLPTRHDLDVAARGIRVERDLVAISSAA